MTKFAPYRKAYAALTAAILATIGIVFDGSVDAGEAMALATAWLAVPAVFFAENEDEPQL